MSADPRASFRAAPAVFAVAGAVLVCLASAGPGFRDAGELGAAARVLGVPHPTGFSLQMLWLHAAGLLPLGSIALRQNVAIALAAAAALAAVADIVEGLAVRSGSRPSAACAGGVVAAVALACWPSWLLHATRVEVYAPALALVAIAGALMVRGRARLGETALLAGLSLGTHVVAVLAMAPLLLAAFRDTARPRRRALPGAAILALAGAAIVLYLPLASMRDPPVDWGDPQTLGRLWEHLTAGRIRQAYDRAMLAPEPASVAALARQLAELWPLALPAAFGVWRLVRPQRGAAAVLAAMLCIDVAYAAIVNPMGIADRQVGQLAGGVLCLFGGLGVAILVDALARGRRARRSLSLGLSLASLLAAGLVLRTPREVLRAPHAAGELFGSGGTLLELPAHSVLLCTTDDGCAGAWFALHAEGVRPDVDAVPVQHLWEPSLRRSLGEAFGLDESMRRAAPRPASAAQRAERVDRIVAGLLALESPPRPLLWESAPSAVGGGRSLVPAAVPPYLVAAGSPWVAASGRDPLVRLDAMRTARRPERRGSTRARRSWARAYERVGSGALATGDLDVAEQALRQALRIAPDRAVGWTNLGVVLARRGALDAAIEASRQAIELAPERPTPWVNLARYAAARGDPALARRTLEAARRAGLEDARLDALREQL